jgi:nucleotide-binding universal stress UspA family protein
MFHSILVAVDGSAHSARAVEEAVDLARSGEGRLTLISVGQRQVVWPSPHQTASDLRDRRRARRGSTGIVDDAAANVPDDVPVATLVRIGRAADEIVTSAREGSHDLIVMARADAVPRRHSCSAASATRCSTRVPRQF